MKKETRKCAKCGKAFVAKAVNQRFCSKKCKREFENLAKKTKRIAKKLKCKLPKKQAKSVVKAVCKEPISVGKTLEVRKGDILNFKNYSPENMIRLGMKIIALALFDIGNRK